MLDVAGFEFEAIFSKTNVVRHTGPKTFSKLGKINLATIQLLRRNLQKLGQSTFDYVVIDEFHHAAAKSYMKVLGHLAPKFLLGLTATPYRGDQQDIARLCGGNVLIDYDLRLGIETGILSPYHYYGCFDDVDYSNLAHNGIRYNIKDLERALVIPKRDEAVIQTWRKHAEGKPTLAFCCSQVHAHRVASSFNNAGVRAEVYLADTPINSRMELTNQLQRGTLKVICSVDVLNEGADIPFLECLLFLRPTESQRVFYQQLGRGLRKSAGKSYCTVIDFIGNFKNAYKIVGYQGLLPLEQEEGIHPFSSSHNFKDIFNLPLGCEVHFDARVIDLFARQVFNAKNATRHNIGRILIYEYVSLMRYLKRKPTAKDIDRCQSLDSSFYRLVFGSWEAFESVVKDIAPPAAIQTGLGYK
jgi:superfamily II DNA or RNA helicase